MPGPYRGGVGSGKLKLYAHKHVSAAMTVCERAADITRDSSTPWFGLAQ